MILIKYRFFLCLGLLAASLHAAATETSPSTGKTIIATANGMVCAFCAQGIERQFKDEPAVDKVRVNLTNRWIVLAEAANLQITDETVRKHIANAGFETVTVRRTEQSFADVVKSMER